MQRCQDPSPVILPYCTTIDQIEVAAHSRIVVATCVTAGTLHSLKLPVGHFSHVFVDEAGQATEPECLLPMSLLAGTEGQVMNMYTIFILDRQMCNLCCCFDLV